MLTVLVRLCQKHLVSTLNSDCSMSLTRRIDLPVNFQIRAFFHAELAEPGKLFKNTVTG
jgi:hypothetical protein